MEGTAHFSRDGLYRYSLTRTWDRHRDRITFIMLNPSTADADKDDPSVRRCIGYARAWGYGGLIVKNLYALRSTYPEALWEAKDPVGPDNDDALAVALQWAPRIIAAWGGNARADRVQAFWHMARHRLEWGTVEALRLNKDGSPAHPLYLPAALEPQPMAVPR